MVKNLTIIAVLLMCLLGGLMISDYMKLPSKELFIFYTSNMRGQINPFSGVIQDYRYEKAGGFAFIKGYVNSYSKMMKTNKDSIMLVDTGDALFGSAEATLTMGDMPLKLMGEAGYDAMCIGNLEFEYGPDTLRSYIKKREYYKVPLLACNYKDTSSDKPLFTPGMIIKKAGSKIGVMGLGMSQLSRNTREKNIKDIEVLDTITSVQSESKRLKEQGAELVVLLSHEPLTDKKLDLGKVFPDVDIIIGDMIAPTYISNGRPYICQTAPSRGGGVGLVKISYKDGKWNVGDSVSRVYPINSFEVSPDLSMVNSINSCEEQVDKLLEEHITESKGLFSHSYTEESAVGCLVADCMKDLSGANAALANSGGIKTSLGEGSVTLRNLFNVMPFENNLVVVEMTGSQLENIIESSLGGKTGTLQTSGIKCMYSSLNPSGFRIIQIEIEDENHEYQPLENDHIYKVAINDFMFKNNIDWPEFSIAKNSKVMGPIREGLVNYLKTKPEITPRTERRFTDFMELDETLRLQTLSDSLCELSTPVKNDGTSNSEYCRLLADVLRCETKSDFAVVPVEIVKKSKEELQSIIPSRIISDFSSVSMGVFVAQIDGESLLSIVKRGLAEGSSMPLAVSGFSIVDASGTQTIKPWNNEAFDPKKTYNVAINEGFPLRIEGVYNITHKNLIKYSSDIRRTFVNGLRTKDGKVELKSVFD